MRVVRVTDPQGVQWQASVRWRPRHRALVRRIGGWRRNRRKDKRDVLDGFDVPSGDFTDPSGCLDDVLIGLAVAVAVVVLIGVFWWVARPLLLRLLDGLIVLALLLVGIAGRVPFRRPWNVDVRGGEQEVSVPVVGWRRALRARDGIARHNSRLHHIGMGRRQAGTRIVVLAHDLNVRVLTTHGELLRALTLEPTRTTNQRAQK